jgi:crossover junction endodeoxyribonuclease RusA
MRISIELPYPPSVNNLWRHVGPRVLISRAGRQYREAVGLAVLCQVGPGKKMLFSRLRITVHVTPPDRRARDLDNMLKAPLDALCRAGVYKDDAQIDHLTIIRLPPKRPPGMTVIIEEYNA